MSCPAPALDHLIHLHPSVSSLESSIALYSSLGFLVTRGGNHADLLTTNALIVLPDGVYIELIAFLDYESPGLDRAGETREQWQARREQHWWSAKQDGWIDWCLAGGVEDGQVQAINAKAQQQQRAHSSPQAQATKGDATSLGLYKSPRSGGRTTLRGDHIKWNVTFPQDALTPLALPFWCEDLTPRSLRVPPPTPSPLSDPKGSVHDDFTRSEPSPHPNGVRGVTSLLFLFDEARFEEAMHAWSLVLPRESGSGSGSEAVERESTTFLLSTPSAAAAAAVAQERGIPIRVHARPARDEKERAWLAHRAAAGAGEPPAGALYEVQLGLPTSAPPPPPEGSGVERSMREAGLGRMSFHRVS